MMVYAEKDEAVTCEKGHVVFTFAETVYVGVSPGGTNLLVFEDDQRKPECGEPLSECLCHCGARYVGGEDLYSLNSFAFHFIDGWRG